MKNNVPLFPLRMFAMEVVTLSVIHHIFSENSSDPQGAAKMCGREHYYLILINTNICINKMPVDE